MSTNIGDYFEDPWENSDLKMGYNKILEELDGLDLPDNLMLEDPGLMASEFFDTLNSIEESTTDIDSSGSLCDDLPLYTVPAIDNKPKMEKKPCETITSPTQIAGKLVINNPNGKKLIITKPFARNRKNFKPICKVQSATGNGRTVYLPIDVSKLKNVKIINRKEIFTEPLKITKAAQVKYEKAYSISSPGSMDDDSDSLDASSSQRYPPVDLNEEEKRLLMKEGIHLPSHYPLTKSEEKELKRIRRKIRNKISAQDSRKRKKEYVDRLEERLRQNAEEKKLLINKVKVLQHQNNSLVGQLQKLQSLLFSTNKATPTTCLMVVLVSVLLVSLPNLSLSKDKNDVEKQQSVTRRSLLSSQATPEDNGSLDEFLLFNKKPKPAQFQDEPIDDGDSYYYEEYKPKAPFLDVTNIRKDVQSTIEKMKAFFMNQCDFEGNMIEDDCVSEQQPRIKRFSNLEDYQYLRVKQSKVEENYIGGELNSGEER